MSLAVRRFLLSFYLKTWIMRTLSLYGRRSPNFVLPTKHIKRLVRFLLSKGWDYREIRRMTEEEAIELALELVEIEKWKT